jgi:hypothetical protein
LDHPVPVTQVVALEIGEKIERPVHKAEEIPYSANFSGTLPIQLKLF